jgi:hypothetical protein
MDVGAFTGLMLGLFFGGLGIGYGGYSMHSDYPLIAALSYVFGGGCVAASIVLTFLRIGQRESKPHPNATPAATSQEQSGNTNPPEQMRKVEDFYKTYDNALLTECETNIRTQANQYAEGQDRERFLIRLMATLIVLDAFERTWLSIFGGFLMLRPLPAWRTQHPAMISPKISRSLR